MNIAAIVSGCPWTTGAYLIRCLRAAGHKVVVVATSKEEDVDVDLVRPDVFSARRIMEQMDPPPDVAFYIESGARFFPHDIAELPALTAWYAIDTHLRTEEHVRVAQLFDVTFVAQKQYVNRLNRRACTHTHWLPLAADAGLFGAEPAEPPTYDIAFVGGLDRSIHPYRCKLLDKLRARYAKIFVGNAYLQDMAQIYGKSRIVFNRAVRNDINMRVFEGMASGALLVTDAVHDNGMFDLFEPGRHFVAYETEDDLFRKIDYYLEHEDERKAIAKRGRELVLAKHTYAHRAAEVVRIFSQTKAGTRKLNKQSLRTLWRVYDFVGSKAGKIWCAREACGKTLLRKCLLFPAWAVLALGAKYCGRVEQ